MWCSRRRITGGAERAAGRGAGIARGAGSEAVRRMGAYRMAQRKGGPEFRDEPDGSAIEEAEEAGACGYREETISVENSRSSKRPYL